MTIRQYLENKRTEDEYRQLAEQAARQTTEAPAESAPETETQPQEEPYVSPVDFAALTASNPDTIVDPHSRYERGLSDCPGNG